MSNVRPGSGVLIRVANLDQQRIFYRELLMLGNPVVVTIIYLVLGFECGLWHPGWLVFFLIPIMNVIGRR